MDKLFHHLHYRGTGNHCKWNIFINYIKELIQIMSEKVLIESAIKFAESGHLKLARASARKLIKKDKERLKELQKEQENVWDVVEELRDVQSVYYKPK